MMSFLQLYISLSVCTVYCLPQWRANPAMFKSKSAPLKWFQMKTPERWCPSRVMPSLSVFFSERPSNTHFIYIHFKWCDVMVWHHMIYVLTASLHWPTYQKLWKSMFFNMTTLTFDLDLRTHWRYYQGTYPHQILGLYFKPFSQHRWRGREKVQIQSKSKSTGFGKSP